MARIDGDYIVQPVAKALDVLDYIVRHGHMVSLSEIVNALRLPKTTVFRYLQTLAATGFVAHDIYRDRYGTGPRLRELAQIDQTLNCLRESALPEMRFLVETFNETVNLGVLSDRQVVYIDMIEPGRPLRAQARIGHRNPLHSTSLGKAILAHLPESEALFPSDNELPQRTINTVTDIRKLNRQTADVRRRGYAIERGENEDGLMCIGVPILDASGYPRAAISLSAPERRMSSLMTDNAADALKGAAWRIAARLDQREPSAVRG